MTILSFVTACTTQPGTGVPTQAPAGDAAETGCGTTTWYADDDGDGFGDGDRSVEACTAPVGWVLDHSDCDDADAARHPGAVWFRDADGDGYGDAGTALETCSPPLGFVPVDGDCDDDAATTYPGAAEVCDVADNDCNGVVDDEPVDGIPFVVDEDGDGWGDGSAPVVLGCFLEEGLSLDAGDCDDADPQVNPDAVELCDDGIDQDCSGHADNGCDICELATAGWVITGSEAGGRLGDEVFAVLGDVTDDGVDDLAFSSSGGLVLAYNINRCSCGLDSVCPFFSCAPPCFLATGESDVDGDGTTYCAWTGRSATGEPLGLTESAPTVY